MPLIKRSRMLILRCPGRREELSPGDGDRFLHHVCKPALPISACAAGPRRPPCRRPSHATPGAPEVADLDSRHFGESLEPAPWEGKGCRAAPPGWRGASPPRPHWVPLLLTAHSHLPPCPAHRVLSASSPLCAPSTCLKVPHLPPPSASPLQAFSLLSPAWQGHQGVCGPRLRGRAPLCAAAHLLAAGAEEKAARRGRPRTTNAPLLRGAMAVTGLLRPRRAPRASPSPGADCPRAQDS